MDPSRTPVVIGVGQITNRIRQVETDARPAHELMLEAVREAIADTGAAPDAVLAAVDRLVANYCIGWYYPDLARQMADALGIAPAQCLNTIVGGNTPQLLVNDAAEAIARGELELALMCGGEAVASRRKAHRIGYTLPWPRHDAPDSRVAELTAGCSPYEIELGLFLPSITFPMYENVLRARAGEGIAEHQVKISELMAAFSSVAATHPNAWYPQARTAEEIRTVTDTNRMIGFPYPKFMNALPEVDMGAALIVCSAARAQALGVPESQWVYPLGGADYDDAEFISTRVNFYSSPAARACGAQALAQAGLGVDDVRYVDLYSCFPCVPQIGAAELGLTGRPWNECTLTGGLPYFGGPWNNYSMHAIATLVQRLRDDPEAVGLIYAIGMWLAKHSVGVYSGEPRNGGYTLIDTSAYAARVGAVAPTPFTQTPDGPVTVETYSVTHARSGEPDRGYVFGRLEDGTRCLGLVEDPATLEWMETHETVGAGGRVRVGDDGHPQFALAEG